MRKFDKPFDWSWLGGLMDGDGSFYTHTHRGIYKYKKVSIASVCPEFLVWIHKNIRCGSVQENEVVIAKQSEVKEFTRKISGKLLAKLRPEPYPALFDWGYRRVSQYFFVQWLAGFTDADGHISYRADKNSIRYKITNTNQLLMYAIADLIRKYINVEVNVTCFEREAQKPEYIIDVAGQKARNICYALKSKLRYKDVDLAKAMDLWHLSK